ncbi:beta-ketoacyl-ACP synthase III [Dyadobacter jiangsuensis]|jgi:3-oxoacyl-[acyl-carrier-protein] synthase III|uniref:Beta-ketoacyl-[acyl-carrier-protein] synthase III n=1 Tax=Dyadobacter fermentans TaxID=94254 RepID=A0ABU1QPJ6_9BACT|nr:MULTISPECIES: beta-ketoacyl-ACP synthase III [Dyadobacter]MBZ1358435.1 ketoacyl-ACP synthase III [Dyadobacter fermentans]MDR6803083.1 3-oxoacyl-[acyl-carrier-protein] synthase-3 [Dyadobacter fermentans]MDR7040825.1 3-oxoacyl-[acyl-carrier-protein] synthase-3 [Dyadobacter sp. BE242]MDR7260635.1 3-oxoacyl-[acyl-carrier-protein] synthase-3 [Dyadobacter sp. BE32]
MTHIKASITGIQGYVPDYVLTNAELETMVATNDEWIVSRTGIKERRILKGEGLGSSHMGAEAVKGLLAKTNTRPEEVDLLICATTTPDFVFPCTANLICDMVGIRNIGSFDIQAACSGFIYALTLGSQFIETGKYKKVIVVGADKMSAIVDYTDRKTCILFGDGAGAVLLEPDTSGNGILDSIIKSDGAGYPYLNQKAGGSRYPPTHETVDNRLHYVYQDGAQVFKFAVTNMADIAADIMERNGLNSDNVAWLVPHQANRRIIEATANRMGVGMDKVMMNIHKYGNTTAATIPLCLWDYESQLKKGDNLILAAFGGGFTWGAMYLKWGIGA